MSTHDDGPEWLVQLDVTVPQEVAHVFYEWALDFDNAPCVPGVDNTVLIKLYHSLASMLAKKRITRRALASVASLVVAHIRSADDDLLGAFCPPGWGQEAVVVWSWLVPIMEADPVLSTMPELSSGLANVSSS